MGGLAYGDAALAGRQTNGPAIGRITHPLDPGDGPLAEEGQHSLPIVGRPVGQGQLAIESAILPQVWVWAIFTKFGRRAADVLLKGGIEAPQAAVAGGKGGLGDRHVCIHYQFFSKQQALVVGDGLGCGSDMLLKQSAQVPGTHAQSVGQIIHGMAVQNTLADQIHGPGHGGRCAVPGRRARSRLGPTAQAGAQTGGCGRGGRRIVDDIFWTGRRGRADGTAIDARALDTDEKEAVKAWIPGQSGAITNRRIECHRLSP